MIPRSVPKMIDLYDRIGFSKFCEELYWQGAWCVGQLSLGIDEALIEIGHITGKMQLNSLSNNLIPLSFQLVDKITGEQFEGELK